MKKDAIVVLGGGIKSDGSLPNTVKYRVKKGVELYKKSVAPRIIMSGRYSFLSKTGFQTTEAQAMKEYAVFLGVRVCDVFVEAESQDTISNAYLTKVKFIQPNKWRNFIVVTSDFHVKRTKYVFSQVFDNEYNFNVVGAKTMYSEKRKQEQANSEKNKMFLIQNWFYALGKFFDFDK